MGLKAMSAKNSADAEAARYSDVRHIYAFSSPSRSEYKTLNTSYRPNLKRP
jgi:hypothetical protein